MVSKMVSSGLKRTVVPVLSDSPMYWSSSCGTPRLYTCFQRFPSADGHLKALGKRVDAGDAHACRPPDTFVGGVVELAAAWSLVMTT